MKTPKRGFTLLEIMVAVAILGLSLTVILSAQAGLYAGGNYGQHTSVATSLLRCRMTEIEEKLVKLGFALDDEKDDGPCCEGELRQDMKCEWRVERIELPAPDPMGMGSDGGLGSVSGGGSPLSALAALAAPGGAPGSPSGSLTGVGGLSQLAFSPDSMSGDGGISNIASALREGTGGGMSAIAQLAMTMVYPTLKPMLEASIRKITVKVIWKEGSQSRDISAVQYVTKPMRSDGLTSGDGGVLPMLPGFGTPGGGGIPGLPGVPTR